MIDAMREDVGEMIVRCGVNEVGVAVCRWGYVHGLGRLGQLACAERTIDQSQIRDIMVYT
jgi:hypothetical protein